MSDFRIEGDLDITNVIGLDKIPSLLQATIDRAQKTVNKEKYLNIFSGGLNEALAALGQTKLSATTAPKYTQSAVAIRALLNEYASSAAAIGDASHIVEAAGMREYLNKAINSSRNYVSATEKSAKKREKQLQDAQKEAKNEQERAEKEKQVAAKLAEKAGDARSARYTYTHSFNDLENRLDAGDISYEEASELFADLNVKRRRRVGTYTAGRERWKEDNRTRKEMGRLGKRIKGLDGSVGKNTKAIKLWTEVTTAMAAGAGGIAFGGKASSVFARYYGDRETAFSGARDTGAQVEKWAGGAIGAAIGFAIAGPIGAAVLGAVGAFMGGEGERRIAAARSSQKDAVDSRRWRALYGNRTNGWNYAKMAAGTGFVTQSDMETFTSTANTFMAAAAFGGVSDQQYLALSMMPNYWAALVSGADDNTRLAAYQRDMEALGPGMGQYFSQMAGVPENIRALAGSGMLGAVSASQDEARRLDAELGKITPGLLNAQYNENMENVRAREASWRKAAASDSIYDYSPKFVGTGSSYDMAVARRSRFKEDFRADLTTIGALQSEGNVSRGDININIDGEKVVSLPDVYYNPDKMMSDIVITGAGSM